jgi:hypothetical protein
MRTARPTLSTATVERKAPTNERAAINRRPIPNYLKHGQVGPLQHSLAMTVAALECGTHATTPVMDFAHALKLSGVDVTATTTSSLHALKVPSIRSSYTPDAPSGAE